MSVVYCYWLVRGLLQKKGKMKMCPMFLCWTTWPSWIQRSWVSLNDDPTILVFTRCLRILPTDCTRSAVPTGVWCVVTKHDVRVSRRANLFIAQWSRALRLKQLSALDLQIGCRSTRLTRAARNIYRKTLDPPPQHQLPQPRNTRLRATSGAALASWPVRGGPAEQGRTRGQQEPAPNCPARGEEVAKANEGYAGNISKWYESKWGICWENKQVVWMKQRGERKGPVKPGRRESRRKAMMEPSGAPDWCDIQLWKHLSLPMPAPEKQQKKWIEDQSANSGMWALLNTERLHLWTKSPEASWLLNPLTVEITTKITTKRYQPFHSQVHKVHPPSPW